MAKHLSEKAMLIKLSISQWTGSKMDLDISEEVAKKYGAKMDAGRYHKMLVAQEAIKRVQKAANVARNFHYKNTLPWLDEGSRILPSANYLTYAQEMRKLRAQFENAVAQFVSNYPDLIEEAKERLNGMFKARDYPAPDTIAQYYNFDHKVDPLPAGEDFRVSLAADEVQAIKSEIEGRIIKAQAAAMQDLWQRLYKAVGHMVEKLSKKDAVFRDSLIGNLTELCDLLPRLNITNDPALNDLKEEVKNKLCCYPPEALRTNEVARIKAHQEASLILENMVGYVKGGSVHESDR